MKRFVVIGAVLVGAYFVFVSSIEKKTESKIQHAESLAEEGRYVEALDELDVVQEWFGWTEAAERASDIRAAVEEKERLRDAKERFQQEETDENLDDMEREVRASEERQADAKRRVEEARKAARLLAGEN